MTSLGLISCPSVSVPPAKWSSPVSKITNGVVLEIFDYKDSHSELTDKIVVSWMRNMYGDRWPEAPPTVQAIRRRVVRLRGRHSRLKKQRNSASKASRIQEFLKEEFQLPSIALHHGRVIQFSPSKKTQLSPPTMTGLELSPTAACCHAGSLRPSAVRVGIPSGNDVNIKEMKKQMYAISRNAKKRVKRRELLIDQQKEIILQQKKTINQLGDSLDSSEKKQVLLRSKLDRVNHRATYWRDKLTTIKKKDSAKKSELASEVKLLKEKLTSLDLSCAEAHETVESLLASKEITTFESGKYTNDIRACVYELLSLNVGYRNISPIIKCVLGNIVHKKAKRLPSHGLICNMMLESLAIVQAQLGQELLESDGFSTLQTDGTTKFGKHYAAYDIRVPEATTYVLGIRHVFSGSSGTTLDTFKEILDDIDTVQIQLGKSAVSNTIVSKIKNTMSDRHSAEKLFNSLLEDFRGDVLPLVTEKWNEMTDDEKEQLERMNNFFCGLHYLVGLADSAEEILRLWEAQQDNQPSPPAVSGTQRLVRTACKLFHHRGSQQCGYSVQFRTYLRKKGIHKLPLAEFVGNRFNILFYDAAGVYYLRTHMLDFIKTVHGNHANLLAKAVESDLKKPVHLVGCRALGLIDKIVTGPLWRKLQEPSMSVLKLSEVYFEISKKFDQWTHDAQDLIEGTGTLHDDMVAHRDEVFEELCKADNSIVSQGDVNGMTIELLQLLFQAFSVCTKRLLADHLPGGKFYSIVDDSQMLSETASVPTTNVSPERNFALLDRFLREKPNANMVALEAMILYSHNQSSIWLEKMTEEDREKLFKAARNLAPAIRSKFKARQEELQAKRLDSLVKKQTELAKKQRQAMIEKENLTKEISKIGLWSTPMEIEGGLDRLKSKAAKMKSLKLQLQFRQKVMCQAYVDNSVFKFSQNGKQHSIIKLKENLCKLLEPTVPTEAPQSAHPLPSGVVTLEEVPTNPDSLVGHRINHRFEDEMGKPMWYEGVVMSYNQETQQFAVAYDDEAEQFHFNLLEDIENGDLLILS